MDGAIVAIRHDNILPADVIHETESRALWKVKWAHEEEATQLINQKPFIIIMLRNEERCSETESSFKVLYRLNFAYFNQCKKEERENTEPTKLIIFIFLDCHPCTTLLLKYYLISLANLE